MRETYPFDLFELRDERSGFVQIHFDDDTLDLILVLGEEELKHEHGVVDFGKRVAAEARFDVVVVVEQVSVR